LAAGWIGGMLPFIVAWLNQKLGSAGGGLWYPAIYLLLAAVIGLFYLPESIRCDLND